MLCNRHAVVDSLTHGSKRLATLGPCPYVAPAARARTLGRTSTHSVGWQRRMREQVVSLFAKILLSPSATLAHVGRRAISGLMAGDGKSDAHGCRGVIVATTAMSGGTPARADGEHIEAGEALDTAVEHESSKQGCLESTFDAGPFDIWFTQGGFSGKRQFQCVRRAALHVQDDHGPVGDLRGPGRRLAMDIVEQVKPHQSSCERGGKRERIANSSRRWHDLEHLLAQDPHVVEVVRMPAPVFGPTIHLAWKIMDRHMKHQAIGWILPLKIRIALVQGCDRSSLPLRLARFPILQGILEHRQRALGTVRIALGAQQFPIDCGSVKTLMVHAMLDVEPPLPGLFETQFIAALPGDYSEQAALIVVLILQTRIIDGDGDKAVVEQADDAAVCKGERTARYPVVSHTAQRVSIHGEDEHRLTGARSLLATLPKLADPGNLGPGLLVHTRPACGE